MSDRETLLERSKESTAKLLWLDTMIAHYAAMQRHALELRVMMEQQTRMDVTAYETLQKVTTLAIAKLEVLNDARDKHFERHDALMNELIYGGE